jgi:hypothetical protein
MANCDFYAAGDDFSRILDFVFDQSDWLLIEHASRPDSPLRRFGSTSEILGAFDLGNSDALLDLYAPSMGSPGVEEKITFRPRAIPGAQGRTDATGWGLIQLYLWAPRKGAIRPAHLGHNSRVRALKWEPIYIDRLGSVDAWDWREVERISGRLSRFIRKLAVDKSGSRVILPSAARMLSEGATLALNA